jgi:hypothetical protein
VDYQEKWRNYVHEIPERRLPEMLLTIDLKERGIYKE